MSAKRTEVDVTRRDKCSGVQRKQCIRRSYDKSSRNNQEIKMEANHIMLRKMSRESNVGLRGVEPSS